ncbi:MAG TPA: hypothetical protein QF753_07175 [Victivallales bacterium]|nr:hypothetical protein [Victivallales bacterium]
MFSKYKPSDGWLMHDIILWEGLEEKNSTAKGFILEIPDIRSASNNVKNDVSSRIDSALRITHQSGNNIRIQIKWVVNSDYRPELASYEEKTKKYAKHRFVKHVREERVNRYKKMVANKELKREICYIFVSIRNSRSIPLNLSKDQQYSFYDSVVNTKKEQYRNIYQKLDAVFRGINGRITPMTDREHLLVLWDYFNPGSTERSSIDRYKQIIEREKLIKDTEDPTYCWQKESIYTLCMKSGFKGNVHRIEGSDFGFVMDGCYNDIILIESWGSSHWPGQYLELTSLPFIDYSITANVYPVPVKEGKKRLVDEINRLTAENSSAGQNIVNNTAFLSKKARLERYEGGLTFPFKVHYMIRVWDADRTHLTRKVNDIKAAIELISGATYYEPGTAQTQKEFFYIGMPGWIFNTKSAYRIRAENDYLCDRLPISSTYTGYLKDADAIYDGGNFNLVGIKNFINGTPQMQCTFGMQGSGKSATIADILAQTECFFDYTCLVEEGNSYGTYVKLLDQKSIIITPEGNDSINYFDTNGVPLDNMQISFAATLLTHMCGENRDKDRQLLRRSILSQYFQNTIEDKFRFWKKRNQDKIHEIARFSISSNKYRNLFMPTGTFSAEAWVEFRDGLNNKHEKQEELYASVTEQEISRFLINSEKELIRNSHAWYKHEDFPIHSELLDVMKIREENHPEDEVNILLTLLKSWTAEEGDCGKLFDGIQNIKLGNRIDHFELGLIPNSAAHMKSVAAFLISNSTRNNIIKLPRSAKKRFHFEEVGRFMDISGGADIVAETYAQMRKLNCQPNTVIQQYEKFKNSPIRASITGNTKQYLFMGMRDRGDIKDMTKDIYMPQVLQDTLTDYPQPEKVNFSCFTYYHDDVPVPKFGTVKNILSDEMLYVASTKGEDVDKREREIKAAGGDLLDTIIKSVKNSKEAAA